VRELYIIVENECINTHNGFCEGTTYAQADVVGSMAKFKDASRSATFTNVVLSNSFH